MSTNPFPKSSYDNVAYAPHIRTIVVNPEIVLMDKTCSVLDPIPRLFVTS